MRGIQNNLANLQINQVAMEQAAIQAAKNQQTNRVRSEIAEEILKESEKAKEDQNKNSSTTKTNERKNKKQNAQNFKNLLYSKEGTVKTDSNKTIPEISTSQDVKRIDFRV